MGLIWERLARPEAGGQVDRARATLCEVGDRDADGSIIDPIKLVGVTVTRLGMCSPTINQPTRRDGDTWRVDNVVFDYYVC